MSEKITLEFPDGFLWGASTSAHQVEGGNTNDWSEWEKKNAERLANEAKNKYAKWQQNKFPEMFEPENYISGRATDHYNRYEEDFDIAKSLGHNAHRLSIEWSRIEPEEGKFDEKEIEHYREVIKALRVRGIEPFVTLWHWTDPLWVSAQGGWENKKTISDFVKYTERMLEEFKDLVEIWQPLNEPGTYIGMGYVQGDFPPQVISLRRANNAFKNLMEAYRQSYKAIKGISPDAMVGMSHYAIKIIPYKNKLINKIVSKIADYIRNWRFLNSINKTNDFIGIQYYHIDVFNFSWKNRRWGWLPIELKNLGEYTSDMNWDIYPEGMYDLLMRAAKYNKPIYITENGIANADDKQREKFIKANLYWIHKAIREGVDVRGYFYWSLLDNFEWDKGFWPRFGLVEVDYKTMKRTIRPSAYKYAEVCKTNKLKL